MIIEDDLTLAGLIKNSLSKWGYEVFCVEDFFNVMDDFTAINPHLLMIDINLPYFNGYHWCAMIRKVSKIPIIFISSALESMNIIMAINMGADDFISKPFELDILESKVLALLRRSYDFNLENEYLECDNVILKIDNMSVSYMGREMELSKNEFRILEVLMKNKQNVVSREEIMNKLWQSDLYIDDNTLTVNVSRLKSTLEKLGRSDFIKTKRGVGYYVK
jgi:two component transcriptional regulator, winged helix family